MTDEQPTLTSAEAEQAVLGALLIDPGAIVRVAAILGPDDFSRPSHQLLYRAILALYGRRQEVDYVSVVAELEREGKLGDAGGPGYLTELSDRTPVALHVETYAGIVERKAIQRRLVSATGQMAQLAYADESETIEETIDEIEGVLFQAVQSRRSTELVPVKVPLEAYLDRIEAYWDHRTEHLGTYLGFGQLDQMLGGLQASDLCIVAGRPGMGKTSWLLSVAENLASPAGGGKTVAVFSLEMSAEQLAQRLISSETGIAANRLRTGDIDDSEIELVMRAIAKLANMPLYIDDTPGITPFELRTKVRRLNSEQPVDLVMVDYLQLMQVGRRVENRVQEISLISRALKGLARELRLPVLAASQLSRAVESRAEKRPQLSDLRESGCLAAGTPVYLPDRGSYATIGSLEGQSGFNVLSLNEETWRLESCRVSHAFATGRRPVFRLTTQLGRTLRATANHPFLTMSGWQRLDALQPGTRVALPRWLPSPSRQTVSNEELGLLGHLIGDGCTLPRHVIQYTSNDQGLAEEVQRLATAVFGAAIQPRISVERGWFQVYLPATRPLARGKRNPIASWLDSMGLFGLRSPEKFVPEIVFNQPPDAIARFLKHLWSTDGCIHRGQSPGHTPAIYYATSSPRLAGDVQSLLLRIGICARIRQVPQTNKGRDQYHVIVSGRTDIVHFLSYIGVLGTRKVTHATRIMEDLRYRPENTNRDVIPREVWELFALPAKKERGLTDRALQSALGNRYCGSTLYRQNLGRARAGRLAEIVDSPPLANLAHSDVYWDEIRSIEMDGEDDVYDLTVTGHHNFVAGNIIVHNSIEQDSDIVLFLYRESHYEPESERGNLTEVIVAKHRHGPTGSVDLVFVPEQTRFSSPAYGSDVPPGEAGQRGGQGASFKPGGGKSGPGRAGAAGQHGRGETALGRERLEAPVVPGAPDSGQPRVTKATEPPAEDVPW